MAGAFASLAAKCLPKVGRVTVYPVTRRGVPAAGHYLMRKPLVHTVQPGGHPYRDTWTSEVHIYIDPVSGSVLLQVLAAGVLGALFSTKAFLARLRGYIRAAWMKLTRR